MSKVQARGVWAIEDGTIRPYGDLADVRRRQRGAVAHTKADKVTNSR